MDLETVVSIITLIVKLFYATRKPLNTVFAGSMAVFPLFRVHKSTHPISTAPPSRLYFSSISSRKGLTQKRSCLS